jgi:RNA methyltransferase, TrmH family
MDVDMANVPAGSALLSSKSGRVKTARKLARRASRAEARMFLAEGPQAVREALTVPGCVHELYGLPDLLDSAIYEVASRAGVGCFLVDEGALASLTETVSPRGPVAVCHFLDRPLDNILGSSPRLLALCADVRDPGNAGTVIRCADAAGSDGVVLTGTSVDPYNGKTVRASAGSLFHLPLAVEADPAAVVRRLQDAGVTVLAADGAGELDLDDAIDEGVLQAPTAWLFGNEARGLPGGLAAVADHRVRIPIHGSAESLNLGTAAAVCLYASARAHRRKHPETDGR